MMLNIINMIPFLFIIFGIIFTIFTKNMDGVKFSILLIIFGSLFNQILKNILEILFPHVDIFKRPKIPKDGCGFFKIKNYDKTWGMPSGHSQMIWLSVIFWIQYIYNNKHNFKIFDIYYKKLLIIMLIFIAFIVSYSRIYNGCHNIYQVIIGSIIGIIMGLISYKFISFI